MTKQDDQETLIKVQNIEINGIPLATYVPPGGIQQIAALIHSERERAAREAGRHYDAMFQALIDVIGYEPARAIKDGIEASGLTTKEEDNGNKLSHTIR